MRTNPTRLDFLKGVAAVGGLGASGAWRTFAAFAADSPSTGTPLLSFGVLSDSHIRIKNAAGAFYYANQVNDSSDKRFRAALKWFRMNGVDAVVHCGDMAHDGVLKEMEYHAAAFNDVFSGYETPSGGQIAKLVVPGNHDVEGWAYGGDQPDYWVRQIFNSSNYLPRLMVEDFETLGFGAKWRSVWGEDHREVWHKTVNGFHFFGYTWRQNEPSADHPSITYGGKTYPLYRETVYNPAAGADGTPLTANPTLLECAGKTLSTGYVNALKAVELIEQAKAADPDFDKKPYFLVTHTRPPALVLNALAPYQNGICFFGHWHNSASFWGNAITWPSQTTFPAIQCPSLSYKSSDMPKSLSFARSAGRLVDGWDNCNKAAPDGSGKIETFYQGYIVKLFADRLVVERYDFDLKHILSDGTCSKLGADWVLPASDSVAAPWSYGRLAHPFRPDKLAAVIGAPRFAAGAAVSAARNGDKFTFTIPRADGNPGTRVLMYEIEIIGRPKEPATWKSVYAAGCNQAAGFERNGGVTEYDVDLSAIPPLDSVTCKVYPVSALGTSGEPLLVVLKQKVVKVAIDREEKDSGDGTAAPVDVARGERFVLTQGAGIPDGARIDCECPEWARKLRIENGEIVLYTNPQGLRIVVN